jgi:hypothetical protein
MQPKRDGGRTRFIQLSDIDTQHRTTAPFAQERHYPMNKP